MKNVLFLLLLIFTMSSSSAVRTAERNTTMPMSDLGDRFIKALDGNASPTEREQLRQDLNLAGISASQVQGWTRSGTVDPQFGTMYAKNGVFDSMPFNGLQLFQGVAQSIPSTANTKVIFNTVAYQEFSGYIYFDASLSTTDIVIRKDGIYAVSGQVTFYPRVDGNQRMVIVYINTNPYIISSFPTSVSGYDYLSFAGTIKVKVGDVITLQVWHNESGNLNTIGSFFNLYRIK